MILNAKRVDINIGCSHDQIERFHCNFFIDTFILDQAILASKSCVHHI